MVSIINYEGYEDMVEALLEQHKEARRIYEETNQYSFKFWAYLNSWQTNKF